MSQTPTIAGSRVASSPSPTRRYTTRTARVYSGAAGSGPSASASPRSAHRGSRARWKVTTSSVHSGRVAASRQVTAK